ncbi:MAG: hypothetical protein ACLFUX_04750 [Spirochaetaceae bacterium]
MKRLCVGVMMLFLLGVGISQESDDDVSRDSAPADGVPNGSAAPAAASSAAPIALPVERRVPSDVELGSLADLRESPSGAVSVVRELFDALAEERVPGGLLAEEMRGVLEDRLRYMVSRTGVRARVRLGRIVDVSDTVRRLPVVVFGREGGRTTGEVYVEKIGDEWYISDVLVDFTAIDAEAETPVFEPGGTRVPIPRL